MSPGFGGSATLRWSLASAAVAVAVGFSIPLDGGLADQVLAIHQRLLALDRKVVLQSLILAATLVTAAIGILAFRVRAPATAAPEAARTATVPEPASPPATVQGAMAPPERPSRGARHGTILLVEDEIGIRGTAAGLLRQRGYSVISASDGEAALRLVDSLGESFDLLVAGVTMPGMAGRDLSQALRRRFPALRVLFVGGAGKPREVPDGFAQEDVDWLGGSYTPAALGDRIARVLEARFTA